jgi:hypothetical protein
MVFVEHSPPIDIHIVSACSESNLFPLVAHLNRFKKLKNKMGLMRRRGAVGVGYDRAWGML